MRRVLIVDDEISIRTGLAGLIGWEAEGFEIKALAADGAQALEMCEKQVFDLVITDIKMPRMDGLALAREIAARFPYMRVLILSGYSEFPLAQDAMRSRVSGYLLKPVDPQELLDALRSVAASLPALPGLAQADSSLNKLLTYVQTHATQELSLKQLAGKFGFNASYLGQLFHKETRMVFSDYLNKTRVEMSKELLLRTEYSITAIAAMVGYKYVDHYYRYFRRFEHISPGDYRAGGGAGHGGK